MLCRVSPVSLIPIHQATRVSAVGWGTTLEAYATHCLTSSMRSTVKLWCNGSLETICSDRGSGLKLMRQPYSQRFIDVGTSEGEVPQLVGRAV